jgi:Putative polyhydroxyalkanoic acid system protein (PHA_gran_rgn)
MEWAPEPMRITIAHTKGRQQMIQMVDRAFDDAFRGLALAPIAITDQHKNWEGNIMTFSLMAKMGFIRNPVSGTVEVTDRDVTLEADVGMLSKLFPGEKIQTALETRLRKFLA